MADDITWEHEPAGWDDGEFASAHLVYDEAQQPAGAVTHIAGQLRSLREGLRPLDHERPCPSPSVALFGELFDRAAQSLPPSVLMRWARTVTSEPTKVRDLRFVAGQLAAMLADDPVDALWAALLDCTCLTSSDAVAPWEAVEHVVWLCAHTYTDAADAAALSAALASLENEPTWRELGEVVRSAARLRARIGATHGSAVLGDQLRPDDDAPVLPHAPPRCAKGAARASDVAHTRLAAGVHLR